MAAPITWRNVDTPNPAAAAPLLGQAQQSINGAFDQFSKILAQRQAVDNNNVAAGQEVLKQNFLDKLASAKSPEELAQLQSSGALDSLRDGLGAQARAAVRGADEARLNSLREGVDTTNKFNDQLRTRAEIPVIGAIKDLAVKGDFAGARAALGSSNLYDKSGVEGFIHDTEQSRKTEAKQDILRPLEIESAQRSNETGKLQLTAAQNASSDDAETRRAESAVSTFAAAHSKAVTETRAAIETQAINFPNLPRNTDGSLAIERMSPDQKAKLNGELKFEGLPTTDDLEGIDTKAASKLTETMKQNFRPSIAAKVAPLIPSALSTNAVTPIGADADKAARQLRGLQAEEAMAADRFGTISGAGDVGNLAKVGAEVIGSVTNPMTGGRERYNQALNEFLQKGGIPVKDAEGKPTGEHVLPSEGQLRSILGKISTGWFRNTKADVGDLLDDWAKSSEAQAGAAELVRIRDRNRILGIDPIGKK